MYESIQEFLGSGQRNAWVHLEKMRVYVRARSTRYINKKIVSTFDVATVEVEAPYRGQGVFTRFLEKIEADLDLPIYVENVLDPRFQNFFRKRKGYKELPSQFLEDCEQPACFIFTKENE